MTCKLHITSSGVAGRGFEPRTLLLRRCCPDPSQWNESAFSDKENSSKFLNSVVELMQTHIVIQSAYIFFRSAFHILDLWLLLLLHYRTVRFNIITFNNGLRWERFQAKTSHSTHLLPLPVMTDWLPHSAKRHFKLASQSVSLLRRRRRQSGSVVHFMIIPETRLQTLLQWRRFILWLAGPSLSWLFACYGSVERTEASGGCISARRPVWGESSRVESVLLNLLVIAGKKVRRLHIAASQVARMCLFFLVSQRCEGGWNCLRDIFTSSENVSLMNFLKNQVCRLAHHCLSSSECYNTEVYTQQPLAS